MGCWSKRFSIPIPANARRRWHRKMCDYCRALRRLADAGYALVVISNQGGYAKGKTSLRALWLAHERFLALLAEQGAKLDGSYYSYGHPEGTVAHFSGP